MRCTVTLELPDEVSQPLARAASAVSQTPEEWIVASLRRQLVAYDARLRRHFASVDLGAPTGADNRLIDADLAHAYAYADPHGKPL